MQISIFYRLFYPNFLNFCLLLILSIAASPGNQLHAQTITLTYANFPPAPTFPCVQMERWKLEVETRTAGEVVIKTFPGGTLLNAKNMLDGVQDGIADIGCLVFAYQPGRFPLMEAMDLPLGFKSSKVANAVLLDLYGKYKPKSLSKVKVLALFTAPPANIMSKKPIRTMKDLKGYELRCTGTGVRPLKLLGAVPVAMPMSETPEALQKGIVQGIFSSFDILKDFNFAETCRYATECNMQTTSFAVVMNMERWNRLPDRTKKILNELVREHSLWTGNYIDNHVQESIAWARHKYNLEYIKLSPDEYAKWHKRVEPLKDEWIKKGKNKGLPAKEFMEDLLALKKRYEREFSEKSTQPSQRQ